MNTTNLTPLPARPNLEQYKIQAKELVKSVKAGDAESVQRIKNNHPHADRVARFALADAQVIIAREHGFESWPKFAKHIEGLRRDNTPISKFELAVDAIVTGDSNTLESLLRKNPELVRARSTRVHRGTLLHYVSANGFENYRQKTPKNAVQIAKMLLDAGAEVDAIADAYGKDTTLGLVATSIHPKKAGLQIALMELLLHHGASIDGVPSGPSPLISALHNGHSQAAEFLAQHGARLDLEGAAGVGRLDVVKSYFHDDGSLNASATRAQLNTGFLWACEYGHNEVVEFLLKNGADLHTTENTGLTGLHWAVVGGKLDTIRLLLERGAPREERNAYGGTALGQALWSATNDTGSDFVPVIEMLLDGGAEIPPGSLTWLAYHGAPSLAAKERIAEVLRSHGAKT